MSAVANPSQTLYRSTEVKSKYRPGIDGLRAFAVVAVIINHFNKDLLPSGYLGVDIFFVISGYVITSSLAGRESKNFLDFLTGFYERRIKRLVPALVVFVLIASLLISLFNPEPGVDLRLGLRVLIGISNISLYRASTDYFAQSTALNPFTHTWSLGVEEQFYLLFPFLIWFSGFGQQTAKGARNLFFWVGTLTIASLIGFIYLYQVNQPAAYFLMPPRFWEMAAGCLLFIGFQKRASIEQALEKVSPLLVVGAMVGVMFLPVSAAVPATICIVLLSALLIACLKQETAAYKFFTIEKVVYIGLISYSLYLWHWMVLCISRWTIGIHWWSAPFQVGLMILMAAGSYRWIESPTRKQKFASRPVSILGGAFCLVLSASVLKLGGPAIKETLYTGNRQNFLMSSIGEGESTDQQPNHQNIPGNQKLIVLGDSHANHILPLIKKVAGEHSLSYEIIATLGKPIPSINGNWIKVGPTSEVPQNSTNPELARQAIQKIKVMPTIKIDDETTQAIRELRKGDILVLSSRHYSLYRVPFVHNGVRYYQSLRGEQGEFLNRQSLIAIWKKKMQQIIKGATAKGSNVVFFAPLPEFQLELESPAICTKEWFRASLLKDCRLKEPRDPLLRSRFLPEMKTTLRMLENEYKNFYVFDAFPALCPPTQRYCDSSGNSGRLFWDNDHLSTRGALLLFSDFHQFLQGRSLLKKPNNEL